MRPFGRKKKVIIGIHGIGNKPPRKLLEIWWKKAICEGLSRIGHPNRTYNFELAYWAHYLHPRPLSPRVKRRDDPRFIENPYVPAPTTSSESAEPGKLKLKSRELFEKVLDRVFLPERKILKVDLISDFIIRKKFHDLYVYFQDFKFGRSRERPSPKDAIRQELGRLLLKHRRDDILLIAHSMGSIIAYDVLSQVVPEVKIHTFVTLGSPLGLPVVMKRFLQAQGLETRGKVQVPTPENIVHAWFNFSDLDDRVAINYNLSDDYRPNSRGVGPVDAIVHNNYQNNGTRNPHAVYGYLRAPEVAQVIHAFLARRKVQPLAPLRRVLARLRREAKKAS